MSNKRKSAQQTGAAGHKNSVAQIEAHRDRKSLGIQSNARRYLDWVGRQMFFRTFKTKPPLIIVRAD